MDPFECIELTNGGLVLVDVEDYTKLGGLSWRADKRRNSTYAVRNENKKTIYMHRVIMEAKEGQIVDHVNGNGLDNRRENLRLTTHALNAANSDVPNGETSKYRGVSLYRRDGTFQATIGNNPRWRLGRYETEEAAALAYDVAAIIRYGDHARINFKGNILYKQIKAWRPVVERLVDAITYTMGECSCADSLRGEICTEAIDEARKLLESTDSPENPTAP